jgi:hypothetical protein
MPKKLLIALAVVAAGFSALSLPGCTTEQAYLSAQGWQRNQCNKLPDKAEVDRCVGQASTTYESYKRQTEPEQR